MDAVIFETPEGNCYIQPQHIVGAFAHPTVKDSTVVCVVTGQTFTFNAEPKEVWEQISGQIKAIATEKQINIAEIIAAMSSKKANRGEMN